MDKTLIFATTNQGKAREVRAMLPDWTILTLDDIGFLDEIIEGGTTFEENALVKAETLFGFNEGYPILADDSGLCIDYLDGKPGVYSSRFLGENTPYYKKNKQIIEMMKGVPEEKRGAHFTCAMVLLAPNGAHKSAIGVLEGKIAYKVSGGGGFGYDPIFFVPESACTTAQMPAYEKNKISHRAKALRKLKEIVDSGWLAENM